MIFDLVKTAPMASPYLESLHPILMGHGVIVSMLISGSVFVIVSLRTEPADQKNSALFFQASESPGYPEPRELDGVAGHLAVSK